MKIDLADCGEMITFVRFLIKDTSGVCGEWLSPLLRLRHLCQAKPKGLRL